MEQIGGAVMDQMGGAVSYLFIFLRDTLESTGLTVFGPFELLVLLTQDKIPTLPAHLHSFSVCVTVRGSLGTSMYRRL